MARGKLVAIEGVDGAGKSTLADRLESWLDEEGYKVDLTRWNSSKSIKPHLKDLKKEFRLTPRTYSLMHAADFADRWDKEINPALASGRIVIADRWKYTAFARDVARGNPAQWVRGIYTFAPDPDITFYLRVDLKEAYRRIHQGRDPKYYEAGMDLRLSSDINESFVLFNARVIRQYEEMVREFDFTVIDGSKDPDTIFKQCQKIIKEKLL